MGIRTRAILDGDSYVINGQKQWISNSGFADVMVAFAKVNETKHTAFIIPFDTPGVSLGAEEKKMGIKGSSTRPVFFDNARVPAENVLGEVGRATRSPSTSSISAASSWAPANTGGAGATRGARYVTERKPSGRPCSSSA